MTTQSMPISRTRKDYILSGVVLAAISAVSILAVYFTNPRSLRTNAETELLGITLPNFQGIIMRQPRMTMVIGVALVFLFSGFLFIARPALSFFSRPLAWALVIISAIGLGASSFFHDSGVHSSWFRFFVFCISWTALLTVMAEGMIFYRRFFHDAKFRTKLFHRIAFALVCGVLAGGMSFAYFHYGIAGGAFLDYGAGTSTPDLNIPINPSPPTTVPTSVSSTP